MSDIESKSVEQNIQYRVVVATVVGLVMATTAVTMRLLARRTCQARWKMDDYLMVIALVLNIL